MSCVPSTLLSLFIHCCYLLVTLLLPFDGLGKLKIRECKWYIQIEASILSLSGLCSPFPFLSIRSNYVAHAGLKFAVNPRLASSSQSSCLYLPTSRVAVCTTLPGSTLILWVTTSSLRNLIDNMVPATVDTQ